MKVEWDQVRKLFERVQALDERQRHLLLDEVGTKDLQLRREVESLLNWEQKVVGFLETSPSSLESAPQINAEYGSVQLSPEYDMGTGLAKSARIGAYELDRVIGRGGMGSVWLAHRADREFEREVAIKFLRTALPIEQLRAQFDYERQVLARLNHPNIAQLFDGGHTDLGVPYLIMEYVEGRSLIDYAAESKINQKECVELFIKVCSAVEHAHRQLVVHRDLKPSNILVRADGEPKLLDFGIAKALEEGAAIEDRNGKPEQRLFSPSYASPEQVRGWVLTTSTDVYSLGVILYQLLANCLPYNLSGSSAEDIEGSVCEAIITPPAKLTSTISEDLSSIVMKALARHPDDRYLSARELGEDLRCYLQGRPVYARDGGWAYKLSCWVSRNRLPVSMVLCLLLLSLALGVLVSFLSEDVDMAREHSEQTRVEYRKFARTILLEIREQLENVPRSLAARAALFQASLESLNDLSGRSPNDFELQAELAEAYYQLGSLQGDSSGGNLGDPSGAVKSFEMSLEIYELLVKADDVVSELQFDYKLQIARNLAKLGKLNIRLGKTEMAHSILKKRHRHTEALWTLHPENFNVGHQHFVSEHYLARVRRAMGQEELALKRFYLALSRAEELIEAFPGNPRALHNAQLELNWIGEMEFAAGRVEKALAAYQRGEKLADRLCKLSPKNRGYKNAKSLVAARLGSMLIENNQIEEGILRHKQRVDFCAKVVESEPDDALARRDLTLALADYGEIFLNQKKLNVAEEAFTRAMLHSDWLVRRDSNSNDARSIHASHRIQLGRIALTKEQGQLAEKQLNIAREEFESLVERSSGDAYNRRSLIVALSFLFKLFSRQDRYSEALSVVDQARQLLLREAEIDNSRLWILRELSLTIANYGSIYEAMADDPLVPAEKRKQYLLEARNWYQKCMQGTPELKRLRALQAENKEHKLHLQQLIDRVESKLQ